MHRDLYLDPALFALERERLWARSWIYAGHDSQLDGGGEVRFDLAGRSAVLRRGRDGVPRVDAPGTVMVAAHRGFVFARLSPHGLSLADWAGPMLSVLDDLADRSPSGRLRVAGAPIRSLVAANWKMYLENINDTVHP
ncbi:MAG: hypothetical protein AB7O55_31540, partial [Lautropia sp.]